MRSYLLPLIMLLVIPTYSHAYDYERALNNFAHDCAECATFFLITSDQLETGKKGSGAGLMKMSEKLVDLSIMASSAKITDSRIQMSLEDMFKEIGSKSGGNSILINKYRNRCKELHDKPFQRLKYWIDKKD